MIILSDELVNLLIGKDYNFDEIYDLVYKDELKVIKKYPKDVVFMSNHVPLSPNYANHFLQINNEEYLLPRLEVLYTKYIDKNNYEHELQKQRERLTVN